MVLHSQTTQRNRNLFIGIARKQRATKIQFSTEYSLVAHQITGLQSQIQVRARNLISQLSRESKGNKMKRSTLPAGEILIRSDDKKNEEGAFKREENVSRRASEQIYIGHEGNAVVQSNCSSNIEIQRNDEESGIQGNVYKSSVPYSAGEVTENRPKNKGRQRRFKPASIAMSEIKQAGLKVPFPPKRVQSEIYQSNTAGCNELERHPTSYCNNTHEEQVITSGGKRSSGTGRQRKFNPASVVNFETEHAGTKMLFPPRRLQSDTFQNNTAGCNDFQRRDRESSWNNMQEKVVTCNDENRASGNDQQRELIPALLPISEYRQAGMKVPYPPLNYQSDIHRHKAPTYSESQGKFCYNTTEVKASREASWNETQRKDHKSSYINTSEYLVFCNGANRPNGIARRRKLKPSSVAILDNEQVGFKVPFPPRSMQSNIVHSNTANRDGFQRKDDRTFSYDTHEDQVQNRPSGAERRRKFNPASVVNWETHQTGFQMPFLPRRMQSDVSENNATGCIEYSRKDHQASFHGTHDEQAASNGEINRPSGIAQRRKLNPASIVTSGTHEAGFPPRRMQSYDFENNATGSNNIQRKYGKSLRNNIGEDLVTCNIEKRPSDTARRRQFNSASVAASENQPAGLKVQFPPRWEQSDVIPNYSSAICKLHQREGHDDYYSCVHEEQVTDISENNASAIKRHTTFSSASVASEQVRLPFLPSLNDRPKRHPRGRTPRVAVCSGAESAALESERRRARVFLRRFGERNIPDTPHNQQ